MIQCLETLCALNGVSGDEGQVRSYIRGTGGGATRTASAPTPWAT
ncbi:MAG: hypothetical protein ACLT3D_12660 [Lawsonibacter sp.]